MASWSAENATKAYLKTLKMGKRGKEPEAAEFISALAAGNNAQLMVVTCASVASTTTLLALIAASQQTGGRVICIHQSIQHLHQSKQALGQNANNVEFITGDAQSLITSIDLYKTIDFLLIDCNLQNHEEMFSKMQINTRTGAVLVGYNTMCMGGPCQWSGLNTQFLPIGTGILVTKIGGKSANSTNYKGGFAKKNQWVVKVDKCTGEEHVFRVRHSYRNCKEMEA